MRKREKTDYNNPLFVVESPDMAYVSNLEELLSDHHDTFFKDNDEKTVQHAVYWASQLVVQVDINRHWELQKGTIERFKEAGHQLDHYSKMWIGSNFFQEFGIPFTKPNWPEGITENDIKKGTNTRSYHDELKSPILLRPNFLNTLPPKFPTTREIETIWPRLTYKQQLFLTQIAYIVDFDRMYINATRKR